MTEIEWRLGQVRYAASVEQQGGHEFEMGYRGKYLVAVRCANCKQEPFELLRLGGGFTACPGVVEEPASATRT